MESSQEVPLNWDAYPNMPMQGLVVVGMHHGSHPNRYISLAALQEQGHDVNFDFIIYHREHPLELKFGDWPDAQEYTVLCGVQVGVRRVRILSLVCYLNDFFSKCHLEAASDLVAEFPPVLEMYWEFRPNVGDGRLESFYLGHLKKEERMLNKAEPKPPKKSKLDQRYTGLVTTEPTTLPYNFGSTSRPIHLPSFEEFQATPTTSTSTVGHDKFAQVRELNEKQLQNAEEMKSYFEGMLKVQEEASTSMKNIASEVKQMREANEDMCKHIKDATTPEKISPWPGTVQVVSLASTSEEEKEVAMAFKTPKKRSAAGKKKSASRKLQLADLRKALEADKLLSLEKMSLESDKDNVTEATSNQPGDGDYHDDPTDAPAVEDPAAAEPTPEGVAAEGAGAEGAAPEGAAAEGAGAEDAGAGCAAGEGAAGEGAARPGAARQGAAAEGAGAEVAGPEGAAAQAHVGEPTATFKKDSNKDKHKSSKKKPEEDYESKKSFMAALNISPKGAVPKPASVATRRYSLRPHKSYSKFADSPVSPKPLSSKRKSETNPSEEGSSVASMPSSKAKAKKRSKASLTPEKCPSITEVEKVLKDLFPGKAEECSLPLLDATELNNLTTDSKIKYFCTKVNFCEVSHKNIVAAIYQTLCGRYTTLSREIFFPSKKRSKEDEGTEFPVRLLQKLVIVLQKLYGLDQNAWILKMRNYLPDQKKPYRIVTFMSKYCKTKENREHFYKQVKKAEADSFYKIDYPSAFNDTYFYQPVVPDTPNPRFKEPPKAEWEELIFKERSTYKTKEADPVTSGELSRHASQVSVDVMSPGTSRGASATPGSTPGSVILPGSTITLEEFERGKETEDKGSDEVSTTATTIPETS